MLSSQLCLLLSPAYSKPNKSTPTLFVPGCLQTTFVSESSIKKLKVLLFMFGYCNHCKPTLVFFHFIEKYHSWFQLLWCNSNFFNFASLKKPEARNCSWSLNLAVSVSIQKLYMDPNPFVIIKSNPKQATSVQVSEPFITITE
jgi:hypothetical protein